ncbi:putative ATPase [Herbihabitans rhizosphaerae]|uniref:Putative ATPase n=1 Tax=Herbihabitans rhizosphaerae TaxID=1872711 RepID=A0A4Q7L6W2_9PSEU|nr:tetratricopeptide repeat protein [Herbihabitans rhizosphaerae]RZS45016.1 putative ATPase [Herbihabitans rhizosphaerae]
MAKGDSGAVVFGARLKRLRTDAGETLRSLAEKVPFHPGQLGHVEKGTRRPTLELARLCDEALGTRPELEGLWRATMLGARPLQLPPDTPRFVGRAEALEAIESAMTGAETPIVVIDGAPGTGKTTLAVHWAHAAARRYSDGQLYVDLRGYAPDQDQPLRPGPVLEGFLTALGIQDTPSDVSQMSALYRTQLADRRLLIVLDNAAEASQVEPLLPGQGGCGVVVTSRTALSALAVRYGAERVTLPPLPPAEAEAMLRAIIGTQRVDAAPADAARLIELCGALPLAVQLAAERLASRPSDTLADLVAELDREEHRLDGLAVDDRTAVRAVFTWSYQRLKPLEAKVFRALGLHPGVDMDAASVAALSDVDGALAARALRELAERHLIEPARPGRFRLHDLMRTYAAERATEDMSGDERREAIRRLVLFYLHSTHSSGVALAPRRVMPLHLDPPTVPALAFDTDDRFAEALRWGDAEQGTLPLIVRMAHEHGMHAEAWQIAVCLWDYLQIRRSWALWERSHEIALEAARSAGDRAGEGWVTTNLAEAARQRGDLDHSVLLYEQALCIRRETGDRFGEAWTLAGSGFLALDRGQFDEATRYADAALEIFDELSVPEGRAYALGIIGDVHGEAGRHDDALGILAESMRLVDGLGSLYGRGVFLSKIAKVYRRSGDPELWQRALDNLDGAVDAFSETGDRWHTAEMLDRRGDVLRALGRRAEAQHDWDHALRIYDELSHQAPDVERKLDKALTESMGR